MLVCAQYREGQTVELAAWGPDDNEGPKTQWHGAIAKGPVWLLTSKTVQINTVLLPVPKHTPAPGKVLIMFTFLISAQASKFECQQLTTT